MRPELCMRGTAISPVLTYGNVDWTTALSYWFASEAKSKKGVHNIAQLSDTCNSQVTL